MGRLGQQIEPVLGDQSHIRACIAVSQRRQRLDRAVQRIARRLLLASDDPGVFCTQLIGNLDPAGDPGLIAGAMLGIADITGIDQQCLQLHIGNLELVPQFAQIDRIAAAQMERDDFQTMIAMIGQH